VGSRRLVALLSLCGALLSCSSASAGAGAVIEQQDGHTVFSPDVTTVAFERVVTARYSNTPQAHVMIMSPDGNDVRDLGVITSGAADEDALAWAGNNQLVVHTPLGIEAVRTDTGHRIVANGYLGNSSAPVSPDGWLVFQPIDASSSVPRLDVVRLDGTGRRTILSAANPRFGTTPVPGFAFSSAAFSPDGSQIAFVAAGAVWTVDRAGDDLTQVDTGTRPFPSGPLVWSPDATRLAYAAPDGVRVVDTNRRSSRLVLETMLSGGGTLAWSPSGASLLVPAHSSYVVVRASGGPAERQLEGVGNSATWSPDGSMVVINKQLPGCRTTSLLETSAVLGNARVLSGDCRISGTNRADHIAGDDLSNVIHGFAGNDVIRGGKGHDLIDGGAGNDLLDSGPDGGTLIGGPGRDRLIARDGNDLISARDGYRDVVDCGPGLDRAVVDRFDVVENCERLSR
jgi:Ca2+-binding RTX toxin-like protein